ncbi:plasmid recombination protein [Vibrio parahaemolyticus]|nr:plasmid recombination protein [Vibrio parahaemolyticus]
MSNLKTILRFKKLKSHKKLRDVNSHNQRFNKVENANPEFKNIHLYGSKNLSRDIKKEFNKKGIKPRKDSVLAMEAIITLSPEYFSDDKKTKDFTYAAVHFLKENFDENVISITLHVDETSPHIHAIILPITEKGRLSAFECFAPNKLAELQDKYCKSMNKQLPEKFTYEKGSKAKHTEVKKFYTMAKEAVNKNETLTKEVVRLENKLMDEQDNNFALSNKVKKLETQIKQQQEEITGLKKLIYKLKKFINKIKEGKKKTISDPYELPELTIHNNPDVPKELQKNKRRNRPSI